MNKKSGTKHDNGKPQLDLLPMEALEEISKVLTFGLQKYSKDNWKGGLEYSRLIAAALRHIYKFNSKIDTDDESGENHIAHAACNLMFLLYFIRQNRKDLDDR